jgi:hypothetical protein
VLWIPLGAWIGALVIGIVVLGFCGYEIAWKSRRLQADLRELGALAAQLAALRDDALAAQQRLAAAGRR